MSGGLTIFQSDIPQTGNPFPQSLNLNSYASLDSQWENGWTSSLLMRHLRGPSVGEQESTSLPSITTFDLTTHYRFPTSFVDGQLEMVFGFLNLTNTAKPFTQFSYNSHLGLDQSPFIDLNYFPGHPRMAVGGFSWNF